MTEALDGVENAIGGFYPLEGFRTYIMLFVNDLPLIIIGL